MEKTEAIMEHSSRFVDVEWTGDVCLARFRESSLDEVWISDMADELRALVEEGHCQKLVVSFEGVECLYSLLLGKLMMLRRTMVAHGGRLKLCDVSPLAREVFRVCRLEGFFEFAPDRDTALRDW